MTRLGLSFAEFMLHERQRSRIQCLGVCVCGGGRLAGGCAGGGALRGVAAAGWGGGGLSVGLCALWVVGGGAGRHRLKLELFDSI